MDGQALLSALAPTNLWGTPPPLGTARPAYIKTLREALAADVAIGIKGVRRGGKTTIALQLLAALTADGSTTAERTCYVNLEDPRLPLHQGASLLDDLVTALRAHISPDGPSHLVLDEVHRLPGWERWVRTRLQQQPMMRIIVTGSSSHLLSRELGTVLTGRHLDVEVFPLSFAEYLRFTRPGLMQPLADPEGVLAASQAYLVGSSFPQVVLTKGEVLQQRLLHQLYRDVLTHDVARRYNIKEIDKLEDTATQLLATVPGPVTLSGLRRAVRGQVSLDSVSRYCRYLEEPYLVSFVSTYSKRARTRANLPRKVYAIDNGLLGAVVHRFRSEQGLLLENAVFLELRRRGYEVFRFHGKREVDFLLWQGTEPLALINACVEVKDPQTRLREIEGLREAMLHFGLDEGLIVTLATGEEVEVTEGRIRLVPFHQFALEQGWR